MVRRVRRLSVVLYLGSMAMGYVFTLRRHVEDVDIDGERWTLEEMDGTGREAYLSEVIGRAKISPETGKAVGVKTFNGMWTDLLKRCLRDPHGKLADQTTMQAWPATALQGLFEAAKRLNALDDEDQKKAAKND